MVFPRIKPTICMYIHCKFKRVKTTPKEYVQYQLAINSILQYIIYMMRDNNFHTFIEAFLSKGKYYGLLSFLFTILYYRNDTQFFMKF